MTGREALRLVTWSAAALLVVFGVGLSLGALAVAVGGRDVFTVGSASLGADLPVPSVLDFFFDILTRVGWLLLPLAALWLVLRRLRRLALFATIVGSGALALTLGLGAVARWGASLVALSDAAPSAESPIGEPGASVLVATVTLGMLLLVFLPAMPVAGRVWAIVAAVMLNLAFLGVAFGREPLSSLALAWAVAILWLALATLVYVPLPGRRAQRRGLMAGLSPDERAQLHPAPEHDAPLSSSWRSAILLAGAFVVIGAAIVASGLLITGPLDGVRRFDTAVVEWFAGIRTPQLTDIAHAVDPLGNTPGIIMVLLTAVTLVSALTRRWAPAAFLLAATIGETAMFLSSQALVGRARPSVEHLTDLPATESFPSGHVAASVATYGAIALLLRVWAGKPAGWTGMGVAVSIVLAVALTRLYVGMHYPTDTVFGVVLGAAWLAACWGAFRPDRGAPFGIPDKAADR
ncbi:phosphatase PAP2 family protein [Microbacterium sp. LRZ72]|uniref:phosphatase PAP2 family protein n=1 Tax=Microbacterium sp. LRZ72 TaxID=2942481 RepID=UPI0029B57563|nr:phosphatase PAP2 family protein [Microbacterium sp. LRZ72]MDX2375621.1 phosphatase PAP2 family protein [Microbacterium sp. LRZ72]